MIAREEALERLLLDCERVVVVGETGESSCEALVETASAPGQAGTGRGDPDELDAGDFRAREKVALTAGAYATDEAIRAVAGALAG